MKITITAESMHRRSPEYARDLYKDLVDRFSLNYTDECMTVELNNPDDVLCLMETISNWEDTYSMIVDITNGYCNIHIDDILC